jgi:hypothetical protein
VRDGDPQGLHALIWDEWNDDPPPPAAGGKPLALLSYHSGEDLTASIEPKAVGEPLTDMPVFPGLRNYVVCPLESTYRESWDLFPKALRSPLE